MSPLTIGILAAIAMVLAKAVLLRWLMGKAARAPRPAPESRTDASPRGRA